MPKSSCCLHRIGEWGDSFLGKRSLSGMLIRMGLIFFTKIGAEVNPYQETKRWLTIASRMIHNSGHLVFLVSVFISSYMSSL